MRNMIKLVLGLVLLFTASCASMWPFSSSKTDQAATPAAAHAEPATAPIMEPVTDSPTSAPTPNTTPSVAPVKKVDASLNQARILARMDAIEKELIHQRETVRLLEQGLLTGIPPDDLKKSGKTQRPKQNESLSRPTSEDLSRPNIEDLHVSDLKKGTPASQDVAQNDGDSNLRSKLLLAKEHYQSSRFGLAIADLAGISRDFGNDAADGQVRVWLGKSYLGLKEYSTAGTEFEAYIKGWPSGEFVARCRLDLAKVYVGLGLKERARGQLRRVIKDFEGNEESEMASIELKNIQGAL